MIKPCGQMTTKDLVPAGDLKLSSMQPPRATRPHPLPSAVCHPMPLACVARERGFGILAAEEGEEERKR
jgi:hypothetical protein